MHERNTKLQLAPHRCLLTTRTLHHTGPFLAGLQRRLVFLGRAHADRSRNDNREPIGTLTHLAHIFTRPIPTPQHY